VLAANLSSQPISQRPPAQFLMVELLSADDHRNVTYIDFFLKKESLTDQAISGAALRSSTSKF